MRLSTLASAFALGFIAHRVAVDRRPLSPRELMELAAIAFVAELGVALVEVSAELDQVRA